MVRERVLKEERLLWMVSAINQISCGRYSASSSSYGVAKRPHGTVGGGAPVAAPRLVLRSECRRTNLRQAKG